VQRWKYNKIYVLWLFKSCACVILSYINIMIFRALCTKHWNLLSFLWSSYPVVAESISDSSTSCEARGSATLPTPVGTFVLHVVTRSSFYHLDWLGMEKLLSEHVWCHKEFWCSSHKVTQRLLSCCMNTCTPHASLWCGVSSTGTNVPYVVDTT
jgi:hypothetical protein